MGRHNDFNEHCTFILNERKNFKKVRILHLRTLPNVQGKYYKDFVLEQPKPENG